jgi:hypothetical protein
MYVKQFKKNAIILGCSLASQKTEIFVENTVIRTMGKKCVCFTFLYIARVDV